MLYELFCPGSTQKKVNGRALGLRWDALGRIGVASKSVGMPWGALGRVERRELWVKPGRQKIFEMLYEFPRR